RVGIGKDERVVCKGAEHCRSGNGRTRLGRWRAARLQSIWSSRSPNRPKSQSGSPCSERRLAVRYKTIKIDGTEGRAGLAILAPHNALDSASDKAWNRILVSARN